MYANQLSSNMKRAVHCIAFIILRNGVFHHIQIIWPHRRIIHNANGLIQVKQADALVEHESEITRLNEEITSLKLHIDLADQAQADTRRKLLDYQHSIKDLEVGCYALHSILLSIWNILAI
jgi:hypothetical protein